MTVAPPPPGEGRGEDEGGGGYYRMWNWATWVLLQCHALALWAGAAITKTLNKGNTVRKWGWVHTEAWPLSTLDTTSIAGAWAIAQKAHAALALHRDAHSSECLGCVSACVSHGGNGGCIGTLNHQLDNDALYLYMSEGAFQMT